ncbi:PREDICTED: glutamate receptor ionotropic, kainate 5-like [Ceratosolen solmsi marchali]|uniref:Glutamate receptor ionotropic, kainate 5-like n=1 Tax=Ceratosolen solmsi marchali TaxID=326594 RepID=A0AAJ7E007_9HYME|nr:PREDICTED: glutamate receptor ionotropic, kainate 5-like [Ceratosolen solmsi marchali]
MSMRNILKVNYYKLGIIHDMDCPRSHIIFDQKLCINFHALSVAIQRAIVKAIILKFAAARLPFNESYLWLTVTTASEIPTTILDKLPLTVESELTLVLTRKLTYTLYDVYNHSYRHGGKLNVTYMGYWNDNTLVNHLAQYKYKRRQDFHGLQLNFSVVLINEPETDLETYLGTLINSHVDIMMRYHYALILQLRDMYNFKINLKRSETWGYKVNGTYNGIVGDMLNGIVDISASPFQYKKERLDVCEYTVEAYVVKLYFMFRHPKKNAVRNPFLKPFKQNIWWLALNVSVLSWILLFIAAKVEGYYNTNKKSDYYSNSTSETALITFAAVSQQGLNEGPRMYSGRIVFITLFVWALLMYQFYSASIVGSLLAESPKFINTLADLANSDLQVGCENTPYTRDYFKNTNDSASLYLWKKKLKANGEKAWSTAKEGIHEVSKGGYAFFIDSQTAYRIIEDTFEQSKICELTEIELVPPQYVSLITSRHSPFKKMVIYGIRRIIQGGLSQRLFRIFHHRKPNCLESFRSQPLPVEMHEFSPAMFIIISGSILAIIVMSIEYLSMQFVFKRYI